MAAYKWILDKEYFFHVPFYTEVDFVLADDCGKIWLTVSGDMCKISKGYAWDGCSPKFKVGKKILGIWDGPINPCTGRQKMYSASLVHDILCQFSEDLDEYITQKEIDEIFYEFACSEGFKLSFLYYLSVRFYQKTKKLFLTNRH